jgi:hypothetical protein
MCVVGSLAPFPLLLRTAVATFFIFSFSHGASKHKLTLSPLYLISLYASMQEGKYADMHKHAHSHSKLFLHERKERRERIISSQSVLWISNPCGHNPKTNVPLSPSTTFISFLHHSPVAIGSQYRHRNMSLCISKLC